MRIEEGAKLNRVYTLVLSNEDISKPPPDNEDISKRHQAEILFEISPSSNKHFARYVKSLRRRKRYQPAQFESESQKLIGLLQNYQRQPMTVAQGTAVFPTVPNGVIEEGGRLNCWIEHVISEREVVQLRRRFGYPPAWHYPIRDYFITGRMPKPSFKARVYYRDAPHASEAALYIGIDGSTTLKDIITKPFWALVEGYQPYLTLPDIPRQRSKIHVPLSVEVQDDEILLRVHPDTTQAVVKQYWNCLEIAKLQKQLVGIALKNRKGLASDSVNILRGVNTITDPDRDRVYRHRLRRKGLL